jgi:PAS domain S-box-containing protein
MKNACKFNTKNQFRIFDVMLEGITVYELIFNDKGQVIDGIIEYMNLATVETMGIKPEDAIGKSAVEIFGLDFIQPHLKAIHELHSTGQRNRFEVYYAPTDKYFLVSGFDMPNNLFAVLRTDITEQKKYQNVLRQSEEIYHSLFKNNHAVMILIDPKTGDIADANPAACSFYGYNKEEITELKITDINVLSEQEVLKEMYKAELGKRKHFLFKHRLSNGEIRDVEVYSGPVTVENRKLIYSIIHDITKRKKAESALKKSEKKFRETFENATIGIALTSIDGKIFNVNSALSEMLGYSKQELNSITFQDITCPDDLEISQNVVKSIIGGKNKKVRFEKRYIRKNGHIMWADVSTFLLRKDNNPIYFITHIQDITKRKQAEEELRQVHVNLEEKVKERTTELQETYKTIKEREVKFRELFNKALDMITLSEIGKKGLLGTFIEVNDAAVNILGYTREEFLDMTSSDLFALDNKEEVPKFLAELQRKGHITFESVSITKNGKQIPVEVSVHIFKLGEKRVGLAIARDITERKKAEEELKETIDELKRSNYELQSFAYITSHDLQEPLRTIASFAQLLERRYKGKLDPDADEFIEFMVDGAYRMKEMILGLLEYSRVGTSGHEFTEFESESALKYALNNLGNAISETNAEIISDPLPVIFADEDQIIRVFQNLIGNAIKFRREGVQPEIHISVRKTYNEYIFSVSDNGIGLEEQYSDKIFEVFKRLHAIGEYQGAGIGLAIIKRIMDCHGGRVWVESELGKGSTFYFTIPVKDLKMNFF